jgi:hypothetical protein
MNNRTAPYKNHFKKFIYDLFYPSLLGSMIFQLISEIFNCKGLIPIINQTLILVLYVLDWFFINFYLLKEVNEKKETNSLFHLLDFLIPLFYTLSFFSVTYSKSWIPCLFLMTVFIIISYYIWKMKKVRIYFILMSIIALISFVLNLFKIIDNIIIMCILLFVFYLVIEIQSYKEKKVEDQYNTA